MKAYQFTVKPSYGKFRHDDVVTINSYRASLPLFGRYCDLSFSFYHLHTSDTSINFGMKASKDAGMGIEGSCNKMLLIPEPRRRLEQEIVIPHIAGSVLDPSDLRDGLVEAADAVGEALLNRTESIFETIRQTIRRNLSTNCRDQFVDLIHTRYHKYTVEAARQFLANVNWAFLFDGVDAGKDFVQTLDKFFATHSPRIFPIDFQGDTGVSIVRFDMARQGFDRGKIADLKAAVLLGQVCGKMAQEEFKRFGTVSLTKDDYSFTLRPNSNPECVDPFGNHASLCVHTPGFSCNPIDEIVCCYLSITHDVSKFIRTANIFGYDFVPPWKLASVPVS